MADVLQTLLRLGVDVSAVLVGLARVLPIALLVPALGLRWWPAPLRWGFALVLAISVVPVVGPASVPTPAATSVWEQMGVAAFSGVPIALGAAVLLWAVSMAAGVYQQMVFEGAVGEDAAAGGGGDLGESSAVARGGVSALVTLAVGISFLEMGGPSRVAGALARASAQPASPSTVLATALSQLLASIELAVGFALPGLVVWVLGHLVIAAAQGVSVRSTYDVLSPLRPVVVLLLLALLFERVLEDVAAHVGENLPLP